MKFRVVAKTIGCEGGNCPTTYIDEEGSVIVQGYRTSVAGRLRVPMELLDRHARAEGRDSWGGPTTAAEDGWVLLDGQETELDGVRVPANEGLIELEPVIA